MFSNAVVEIALQMVFADVCSNLAQETEIKQTKQEITKMGFCNFSENLVVGVDGSLRQNVAIQREWGSLTLENL